jgi:hypothetical protein
MPTQRDQTADRQGGFLSILARLFWMAIGNVVLVMSCVSIFQQKGVLFQTADVVFWITVPVLIIVRYLDIHLWDGQTAMGTPASMSHWKKYSVLLFACSTAVWLLCHAVNYLSANR